MVVSIDGASAATHDIYRRSPGSFEKALAGLRAAAGLGIVTRVNTVVGPHNYAEMPKLRRVLADTGVVQWELSALKLERMIVYPDPDDVRRVCDPLYESDSGMLVPLGKRFYGDSAEEQERFFTQAITPRASLASLPCRRRRCSTWTARMAAVTPAAASRTVTTGKSTAAPPCGRETYGTSIPSPFACTRTASGRMALWSAQAAPQRPQGTATM